MTNLPENTTYNTTGMQPSIANLSGLLKNIQQSTQNKVAGNVQSALTMNFDPERAASKFIPQQQATAPEGTGTFPVGDPIGAQQEGAKFEDIPEYVQFVQPDERNLWALPSDQAQSRNLPENLFDGGQYTVDPTQQGALIKSKRVLVNEKINPGVRKALLGKLASSLYQVDHMVPLWAGGTDTLANLTVLDNETHDKKTTIQSVPLTLLANNKITLNEARMMALSWKDKDAKGLPMPDNYGYVPLDIAESYVQKWKEDSKKIETGKYFRESLTEEMGGFGKGWLPTPIREFAKGLVGGFTAGIVPGTEASEESGTVGKVSNFVGNLTGMLTGLKGLGQIMGGAGMFGKATKAITPSFFKYSGIGLGIGQKAGAATKIATEVVKTKAGVDKVLSIANKALKPLGLDFGDIKSISKFTGLRKNMKDSMLLLGTYGQLGLLGRELTGPEEVELGSHIKQAGVDMMFGGLLGTVSSLAKGGQSIRGYSLIGGGTMTLSVMTGSSIQDAFKEGIIMSALHGMGVVRGKEIQNLNVKQKLSQEITKQATTIFNRYLPESFPIYKKGVIIPEVLTYEPVQIAKMEQLRNNYITKNPNDTQLKQLGTIDNSVKAIHFGEVIARRELATIVANAEKANMKIPDELIEKELTAITVSANALRNKTLPIVQQEVKSIKDVQSVGQQMLPQLKSENIRFLDKTSEVLDKIPTEIISREAVPLEVIERYKQTTPIEDGLTPVRGLGRDPKTGETIESLYRNNANFYAKNEGLFDGKFYAIKSESSKKVGDWVNTEHLMAGEKAPIADTSNIITVFVKQIKGVTPGESAYKSIGVLPEPSAFDTNYKYHVNKPREKMIKRFRSHISTAQNVEGLTEKFNGDLAFGGKNKDITIKPENAQKLFDLKDKVPSMSDNSLLKLVDPTMPLELLTIDNSVVASKMQELGLDVFVGDIRSSTPINKGENLNDPNIILSVTNDNAIVSLAMKDSISRAPQPTQPTLMPEQQGVRNIVSKQEVAKVSDVVKKIKEQTTKSQIKQTTEPIAKTAPIVEYVYKPIKSMTGREVAAQSNQQQNKILINMKEVQKTFEEKAWTEPKVKGVEPLSKDSFKTVEEWRDFLISHEKAHFLPEIKNLKTIVAKENGANLIGLKETKINKISPEITELNKLIEVVKKRNLTNAEQKQIKEINKKIREFVTRHPDLKYAVEGQPITFKQQPEINRSINLKDGLLRDTLETAHDAMDNVEVRKTEIYKDPNYYKNKFVDAANNARSLITESKLKMSSQEQQQLLISFNKQVGNIATDKVDLIFKDSKNLLRDKYSTNLHRYPIRNKQGRLSETTENIGKLLEDGSINKGELQNWTPKEPLTTADVKKSESPDQELARVYGLALNDKGYLKLVGKENKVPVFSEEFKKSTNTTKTPLEYWGKDLKDDFIINKQLKTMFSQGFVKDVSMIGKPFSVIKDQIKTSKNPENLQNTLEKLLKTETIYKKDITTGKLKEDKIQNVSIETAQMLFDMRNNLDKISDKELYYLLRPQGLTGSPTYAIFGETVNKILKKVIVEPQEPWMKKLMNNEPGSSYTFNSLMNPDNLYLKKMFGTVNPQGHYLSQPVELIKAQVEGASPKKIDTIIEQTKEREARAREEKIERDAISEDILQKDILTEGVAAEDIKGFSVKDTFQVEKVQDLTNFELRFPSLIYKEITGKNPPKEAIVNDAIRWTKDFISNYNPSIKVGKIKKSYISPAMWYKIKTDILKQPKSYKNVPENKKPDGQGGLFSDAWGTLKDTFSSKIQYKQPSSAVEPTVSKEKSLLGTTIRYNAPKEQINPRNKINPSDAELDEIVPIVASEISNNLKTEDYEMAVIADTALNRVLQNNPTWGGNKLIDVFKHPGQYQAYAPEGVYDKQGNVVTSEHQKQTAPEIDFLTQEKQNRVRKFLSDYFSTKDKVDKTGGAFFFSHARDEEIFYGTNQEDVIKAIRDYETQKNLTPTVFGGKAGLPVTAGQ